MSLEETEGKVDNILNRAEGWHEYDARKQTNTSLSSEFGKFEIFELDRVKYTNISNAVLDNQTLSWRHYGV